MAHWRDRHPVLRPLAARPTRREAQLLVLGWRIERSETSGAVKRVWWRDPDSGEVLPQGEALKRALSR